MFRRCQLRVELEADSPQDLLLVRRHDGQLHCAVRHHLRIFQSVTSDCANDSAPFRNLRERIDGTARRLAAFEKPGDWGGAGGLRKKSLREWRAIVALQEFR